MVSASQVTGAWDAITPGRHMFLPFPAPLRMLQQLGLGLWGLQLLEVQEGNWQTGVQGLGSVGTPEPGELVHRDRLREPCYLVLGNALSLSTTKGVGRKKRGFLVSPPGPLILLFIKGRGRNWGMKLMT